jgi:flagellar biosynthesis/type III secretory pathway M-ring protein FliF/YscJ
MPYQPTMLPAAAAAALHALPMAESMPALQPATDPHEERVLKLADANPRAVADVVQTWMREED